MSTFTKPSMQTSSRDDAVQLNRAFKGLGCDAAVVVNILAHRNASQRDSIQQEYETLFSDDLKKQLAHELHGNLKKAVLLWMKSPIERDVTTLRQALTGPIIDVKAATEIICTRTSSQIRQIKQVYAPTFGTRLEFDIECHTSDVHKKFLLAFIAITRYDGPEIDSVLVEDDAKAINKIGVKKSGVDESTFIQIFTERSSAHLIALASVFHKMSGKELGKTNVYSGCAEGQKGGKWRAPAWCDRIIWYGEGLEQHLYTRGESNLSDHRPVKAMFTAEVQVSSTIKGLQKFFLSERFDQITTKSEKTLSDRYLCKSRSGFKF